MIELLTEEDSARLFEIATDAYGVSPWTEAQFKDGFSYYAYLGYFIDKRCVAFVQYHVLAGEGEILNVAVKKDYQNQGIASKLLKACLKQVPTWFLEVRASNTIAQRLYRSLGFETLAFRKNYYTHPVEDAIIMKKG